VLLLEHGGFRRNDPAPACERACDTRNRLGHGGWQRNPGR
jgi:hypothetical protein